MNASVPNMYVWEMLLDYNRSNAYIDYIKRHAKNKIIVDCGSGSGFFTWLSIKYGAKKVYSLEINQQHYYSLKSKFRNNDNIEVLNLDIFNDNLPKGDIYIHEIFGHCALSEGLLFFLNNCQKQQIHNVYPNNLKLTSCNLTHVQQQLVEDVDYSKLDENIKEYYQLSNKSIKPNDYLYNSDYTMVDKKLIFNSNIFDLLDLKFDFDEKLKYTYFEAGFNDEYYSSFAKKQNQWEIKKQLTYPYLVYPAYAKSVLNRKLKTL